MCGKATGINHLSCRGEGEGEKLLSRQPRAGAKHQEAPPEGGETDFTLQVNEQGHLVAAGREGAGVITCLQFFQLLF